MKKKTGQPELVILQKLELFFIVVMKKKDCGIYLHL